MYTLNQSRTKVTPALMSSFSLFLNVIFPHKLISDAENVVLTRCILKKGDVF